MLTILLLLPIALARLAPRQNATASAVSSAAATPSAAWNGSTSSYTLPSNITFVTVKMPYKTNATNATTTTTGSAAVNQTIEVTGFSQDGLDQFLGIPFAQPPIGALRFAHPKPAIYNSTKLNATVPGPACYQDARGQQNFFRGVGISEDCLTLNIMTPKGAANHTSGANVTAHVVGNATATNTTGLPVMVWIYGGGFTGGAAYAYLSPPFVKQGIDTNKPFILVTVAYRLGIWGFAYGREFAEQGAANLGLRDQMLALEWVKSNIGAFGGDPNKVTVFGESAGAISVALLLLQQNQTLFRGAIMESGAQSTAPLGPANTTWQAPYNAFATAAGCNVTSYSNGTAISSNGSLASNFNCLKALPATTLLNASMTVKSTLQYALPFIWAPSVDGDLVPKAPYKMLLNGTFSRVPFITGTNRDEGTAFIPPTLPAGLTDPALMYSFLIPKPPNATIINKVIDQYPANPSLGAPFDTGNITFGHGPIIKQLAAVITDEAFESRRRFFLRQANAHGWNKTWSYQWQGHRPDIPAYMGYTHGQEVEYVFGVISSSNSSSNFTDADRALSRSMMNYWINFAYDLDPNGKNTTIPVSGSTNSTNSTSGVTTLGPNGTIVGATHWAPHTYPANKNSILFRSAPLNWFAYNVTALPGGNATSTILNTTTALNTLNISMFQDDFREQRIGVFFDTAVSDALFFKRAAIAGDV